MKAFAVKKIFAAVVFSIIVPLLCAAEESPADLYSKAKIAYQKRDYASAVSALDKAIAMTENAPNHNNYYWRARSKFGLRDYAGAIKDFDKIVELKKGDTDPHVYYWRARAEIAAKDCAAAVKDLDKTLETADGAEDFHFYYWRGFAKRELGDNKGALADMKKAESFNPKSSNTLYYQMLAAESVQDYKTAEDAALRCLKLKLNKKSETTVRKFLRDLYKNKLNRPADAAAQDAELMRLAK